MVFFKYGEPILIHLSPFYGGYIIHQYIELVRNSGIYLSEYLHADAIIACKKYIEAASNLLKPGKAFSHYTVYVC